MQRITCDVAVIGAGTAGLTAERAAAGEGATTCLIEAGPGGTTCARFGCMPSKLLIAAADAAHSISSAGAFGIETQKVQIDSRRVLKRVQQERDSFVAGVFRGMQENPPTHYLTGQARFLGPRTLAVGDDVTVEARAIVIATGAHPVVPEPFSTLGEKLLTNETIFELERLPGSVAVLGAGPLGLELAQAMHRLGVRTTVLDKGDRLGGLSDGTVNAVAEDLFQKELDLHLGVDVEVASVGEQVRLVWKGQNGRSGEGSFSRVLVAAGRRPALEGLDLERAEIELDQHGTPVFNPKTMRCGDSAIFIAGDANHDRPLLHEAAFEGKVAGRNAARLPSVEPHERPVALSIVFTDPQIASVGQPPDAAEVALGSVDFSGQGRARIMGENLGMLRLYADRNTGLLAAAQMVCPGAEHLSHLIAWAVEAGLSPREMISLPYYHPTLEEGLRIALRDLCSKLRVAPEMRTPTLEYGPGG